MVNGLSRYNLLLEKILEVVPDKSICICCSHFIANISGSLLLKKFSLDVVMMMASIMDI